MVRFLSLALFAPAAAIVATSTDQHPRALQDETLTDLVTADPELSILATALSAAGLTEALDDATANPLTVFAPIDASFAALDQAYADKLLGEPKYVAHLDSLLRLHTVEGSVLSDTLEEGMMVTAGNGETLTFHVDNATSAVTIDSPKANASMVVDPDNMASNGVVHKVDGVLLPGFIGTQLQELAQAEPNFNILNEFFELSGVAGIIPEGVEATVLAPIDDAFNAIGEEALNFYRNETNTPALLQVLLQHVVLDVVPTQLLENGQIIETIGKTNLTVTIDDDGEVYFNGALVTKANILAQNGVVHAVDMVLSDIPFSPTPTPPTAPTPPVAAPTRAPMSPVAAPVASPMSPVVSPTRAPMSPVASPTSAAAELSIAGAVTGGLMSIFVAFV